jgi:hypothetical protein
MERHRKLYLFILAILAVGCTKPYQPEVTNVNSNYLVVEGLINVSDSTFIRLSRTVLLSEGVRSKPELGAIVTIEGENSQIYPLNEISDGEYVAAPLNLIKNGKYRLRIKASKGQTYLSDFVEAKITPPIDSVGFEVREKGIQLYANAHDDNNKTVYYRWDYEENWQFNAMYKSDFKSDGKDVMPRSQDSTDNIYTCWAGSKSSTIVLGSTAKLGKDVIFQSPLTFINSDSEKLSVKYSTLVRQYALTKEAFDFWENLKKNTESLGSIFDAQPSQLTGNIHNVDNPAEPVIGYISAGTVQQKRIFVAKSTLPNWKTKYPYDCAPLDSVFISAPVTGRPEEDLLFDTFKLIPITSFYVSGRLAGHLGATKECADCTIRGTNKKPAFWR